MDTQERARAAAMGYEDPINPTYEATTAMYEKTLMECLTRIKDLKEKTNERRIAAMVASHNEDTIRFAIKKYSRSISNYGRLCELDMMDFLCLHITGCRNWEFHHRIKSSVSASCLACATKSPSR